MASFAPSGLRLRLLEPAVGAVAGGSRIVIHGKGFRPPPHSLLVRFRLVETNTRIDVTARFLLETQLECVVPNFKDEARTVLARRTTLPPTSTTLAQAPHLVPVHVEVIMDSDRVSNALVFVIHQEILVAKIVPQFVLMTPSTTITVTTNLLKLSTSSRLFPQRDTGSVGTSSAHAVQELGEINSLPVFARVRQVSERTSAVSDRTIEARWRISPVGVYEVEFDAVMMTFGEASVEVTLNRHDYFRAKEKTPDAVGYCVHRDVTLASLDPCCLRVTSGRSTEVRLLGEDFVDSGDLTVRLLQRDIQEAASSSHAPASTHESVQLHPVAQLSATFVNANEIRCSVPHNMSFGLTHFQVSLNGGRQYGKDRAIALLHRDRAVEGIEPSLASLDGDTAVQIRLARLTVDSVDAPHQMQNLLPPRRIRVKFEAINDDNETSNSPLPLVKVVNAEIPPTSRHGTAIGSVSSSGDHGMVCCRVPSFFEEMKALKEKHSAAAVTGAQVSSDFALVRRFRISLSLGGESYFGAVAFGYFFPPVIQSMTRHHGPSSGGTIIYLRMKYRVPTQLGIQVRFLELTSRKSEIVRGIVGTEYFAQQGLRGPLIQTSLGSPLRSAPERQENPATLIVCTAPSWQTSHGAPVLTKVQVSYDGGFNFVPAEEEHELIAAGLATPRSKGIPSQLVKDMSYLYFLFYPVPRLNSVVPMSADIQGGSFIRIGGQHIVDHGGRISVVFQSPELSRKVVGFIENGELRCCVPPFNVGPVTLFVSLNGDQYTKCEFIDPDSKRPIDFVFYSSPVLQRLSPLSTSISHSSLIHIFGVNLIETGRVKVRFGFTNHSGKLAFKDVPGRAKDGVIMAHSPLFAADYGNLKAVVDVALNGNDFSGKMLSLYYYASYSIKRVEPPVGAMDIPIPVTLYLSQSIISDELQVRVRFKDLSEERTFGPVPVARWESNRVDFVLPALDEFARSLHHLEGALVDISFDKVYFHHIGDLLKYYRPYKLPPVITISPLVGQFEQETKVVARCSDLQEGDTVTMTLTLQFSRTGPSATVVVVADTNPKRQTLTWRCPPLSKLVNMDLAQLVEDDKRMILPAWLAIQISTVNGQLLTLPFRFQYYRMPLLLSMSPRAGYICGGSLISFEFKEPIETPTIDFRFGSDVVTSGRVRQDNKRLVECLSPVLKPGIHALSVSFDEQYFEDVYLVAEDEDNNADDEYNGVTNDMMNLDGSIPEETPLSVHARGKPVKRRSRCVFHAFAMPQFTIPSNVHRVYGFGPVDGGSSVVIKGRGFIADGKIYVRFSSPHGASLVGSGGSQSEVVVKARVVDDCTILCTSPPSTRPGRVLLQVTYNLQQYTTSSCFFEYHERTKFTSRGILCGPVSGGAPVCIQVEDPAGLPEDKTLLRSSCVVRFTSEQTGHSLAVDACFDEETLQIECVAPSWPSNELVSIEVALSKHADDSMAFREFFATSVRFLFYDPPEGLIIIEPSAGPITGGTQVLALCGKMVDTGEIVVSVSIVDKEEEQLKALTSVGEDEEGEEDDDEEGGTTASAVPPVNREVHLVKGKIVGEAVSFIAPAVSKPGIAYLNIAFLNGINYTSAQSSILRYKYYCDPVIRRFSPTWSPIDTTCVITLNGDFIEDHGCKPVIRFQQQQLPQHAGGNQAEPILVDGSFVDAPADPKSSQALQCSFMAPQAGYFEIQISLNGGQQFSKSKYMAATYGNYSGSARTALLPFRSFSSPFLLATPTGSVAGGSTVTLFMNKKLCKLLARETKCNVQFTPIKNGDAAAAGGGGNVLMTGSPQKTGSLDGVVVVGEIDHHEAKITCRAPLLRSACVAALDLLLPTSLTSASDIVPAAGVSKPLATSTTALTSCSAFFGAKEREKFHAYESPTITELAPSCGPLSGGTCMVIECSNIVDTGQIFVRFRSSANERECILVPATFSRAFPDGSLSASPLLTCQTPIVEIIDRIVVSVNETASSTAPGSPNRTAGARDVSNVAMTAKARAQNFQQLAEASLRSGHHKNVLRVTRAVSKSAPASSIGATVSVLVDFTMNAGEQFIAHSAPFQFYPVIDPRELKWFPRHLPTLCFDRAAPTETRIVTIQLPKTLRAFTDSPSAAERVAFYFEGTPPQLFSPTQKRRGSSIVLHETGDARELVVLDAAPPSKLRKESTMRRRSTFFRNSSISASSNSLLDSSSAALATSAGRPRAPIARGAGPRRPSGLLGAAGSNPSTGSASVSVGRQVADGTLTSSPYIAAKIVKGGLEITCPVPEFGGCGTVKVFFSFNAQQFVCLGEIQVHEPLTIREKRQHLFTSNIGGDRFTLFCSPSSVFDFLPPSDVLNEAEVLAMERRDAGIVKTSQAWQRAGNSATDASVVIDESPTLMSGESVPNDESAWRDRLFQVLQLHVVPPNPRLLRKLIVSARSLGSRAEMATCCPDDFGCCVFETTEWVTDVLVAATPPGGSSLSSFTCVFPRTRFTCQRDNDGGASATVAHASNRTHALMVELPTAAEGIVACCYGPPSLSKRLLIVDCHGSPVKEPGASPPGGNQYSLVSFEVPSPGSGYYVCLELRDSDSEPSEIHVVVADSSAARVYLTGRPADAGVWVVAFISWQPAGGVVVVEIDCRLDSLDEIASSQSLAELRTAATEEAMETRCHPSNLAVAPSTAVTTRIQFACADSSRNLSASAVAQLVLPLDHTLASFKGSAEASAKSEVVLQCEMAALPFDGPTILSVTIDGVPFSNSLCVHCYDPRTWRITRIDPPCGLVHQPLKMRITGEHFVDTKKTVVRFSDATRYQNFAVTMERYRLLIVRVATVRNLRSLLPPQFASTIGVVGHGGSGISPQKAQQLQAQQHRDETSAHSSFTVVARVEYHEQVFQATSRESAVLTALSSSATASPLGWEDQFEVQIPAHAMTSAILLVTLELIETSGSRTSWELGRTVVPTNGLQEAVLTKRTYPLEEHFRWLNRASSSAATSDVDVFLHLSPLMTQPDVFVCDVPSFAVPQRLRVQVSSGDSFFSPCPAVDQTEQDEPVGTLATSAMVRPFQPFFQTYELPVVTDSVPRVLPRTAGGEITITGHGFIDCDRIWVRLFACIGSAANNVSEQALLEQINATAALPTASTQKNFSVRDVKAIFISATMLKVRIPPRLASYNVYYRISVDDGALFSLATACSHVMMFSADTVEPKGGPVSGNTYVAVHGSNLNACMALGGLAPVVKLTWMRGAKKLEHVIVRGEFYPPEDIVYFYTPQSKFGLQNITVLVEISLVSASDLGSSVISTTHAQSGSATPAHSNVAAVFGQDEIPFVIYRTPSIKAIAPLHSLVCGLSSLEMIVQGLDEKAIALLKGSIKARFKRRGQMQLADVHISNGAGGSSEGKLVTVLPRFVVGSAAATEVSAPVAPASPTRQLQHGNRAHGAPAKVWTRQGAVYIVLLRARNLFVAKKTSTCNPFVVIHCNKAQLKSTRKDGTSSPVWNEIFDFDWRSETELPRVIRLSVENQLSSNQSELLGQVCIRFADAGDLSKAFCARAWLPLRRVSARGASSMDNSGKRIELGDVEVAIAFIPVPPKKAPPKFLQAAALKTSIMSAMQQQKKAAAATSAHPQHETPRTRKELLLRAFKRHGAPSSLVPSEIVVELAVNGQDFWSSAPSRCLVMSTPIVMTAEPSFICMSGGTPLTISGVNFAQSGALRVAFAVVAKGSDGGPAALGRRPMPLAALDSKRIAIVDARYRSSHCITCVTPPLQSLGASESSGVNMYVTVNGLDFDSIALPLHLNEPVSDETTAPTHDDEADRPPTQSRIVIQSSGEKYVINNKALTEQAAERNLGPSQTLLHQIRVYLRPLIHRVRPADGVYTSSLVIEGSDFSNTGIVIARYCSKNDLHDIRTSRVDVISPQRMECSMPDFPRGTVVTMSVAVNGIEFISCPGEFAVFQSPRLTEIVPNWISVATDVKQDVRIRGVNLTTKNSASGSVQVSFQRDGVKKVVKGQCVDGEVLCSIPPELLTTQDGPAATSAADRQDETLSSIFVDVWLGGTHKSFTGRPLELHLYREIPIVSVVAPPNGPIYGGYSVAIEGSGFINTGKIVARFQLLQDALLQRGPTADRCPSPTSGGKSVAWQLASSPAVFVDVSARFVSSDALVCFAPSFPQEGVYSVAIALNGVAFNTEVAIRLSSTWFIAWQNWQRRKQLTAQRLSLETAFTVKVDTPELTSPVDLGLSLPETPGSALILRPPSSPRPASVETAFGRRTTSRSARPSPLVGTDNQETTPTAALDSPRRRREHLRLVLDKMVDEESLERVEDHFVDLRLLQWHPATADDRNRTLAALLSDLLNAPETQQIMIRRIGFVFRVRGSRDSSTGQYVIGSLPAFTHALKLVFPHVPDKEFDELWKMADPVQHGAVSLQSITKRFIVTESLRPRSPEPGPTHYNPNYTLVEPKPPATIILPQSSPPTEAAGLPSELFMNYDAFKAVRPRVQGGAFLKRELMASWCNPVPKDKIFKVETDEELERTFLELQQQQQQSKGSDSLASLASSPRPAGPRPPPFGATSVTGGRSNWKPRLAHDAGALREDEDNSAAASGVSRGDRLARAAAAHEGGANKIASPREAASVASGAGGTDRVSSMRPRSILHDNIAPLYLKFLRSKEAQRDTSATNE